MTSSAASAYSCRKFNRAHWMQRHVAFVERKNFVLLDVILHVLIFLAVECDAVAQRNFLARLERDVAVGVDNLSRQLLRRIGYRNFGRVKSFVERKNFVLKQARISKSDCLA